MWIQEFKVSFVYIDFVFNLKLKFITYNPNSLDKKGSWRILKDCYCSVTMLMEFGLNYHI